MRFTLLTKPTMGVLAALALGSLATAQVCPGDDIFEPNDDCVSATPLAVGPLANLALIAGTNASNVPDFYSYTMADGEAVVIDVLFTHASTNDIDLRLYSDAACTTQIDTSGSVSDNEQVEYTNNTGGALTVTLKVFPWNVAVCSDYSIVVTSTPPPASCPDADAFEPNDDCASASALALGATDNLTIYGAANVAGANDDYYTFSVGVDEIATIDCLFLHAGGDIDIRLYDDAGTCVSQVASSASSSDNEQIAHLNNSGAVQNLTLRVLAFGSSFDCNDYSLNLDVVASNLICPAADAFEPNDDCTNPAPMVVGSNGPLSVFGPLAVGGTNEDSWTYTMVNNESVTIDVLFIDALGDIDVNLYDDALCANQVDNGGSVTDNEQVSYVNTSGGPVTLTMTTRVWGSFECNDYEIVLTSVIDPCLSVIEDAFAPNQDCATAAVVTDGSYPGLATFKTTGEDFFSVDVPDGATLNVDVLFLTANGDIDCYLYDASTLGTTCGDKSDFLDNGFTGSDNEDMTWTNLTGSTQTYYIQVNLWDNAGNEDCNNYDLVIDIALPTMGTSMCAGDGSLIACPCGNESSDPESGCLNSTTLGAKCTATGSNVVANDDAVFHLSQAPAGETAVLIQGTTQIAIPFKDGLLCMGTFTRRVEFVTLDGAGEASTVGSIATNANLFPGQTRWYQWWHRDPAGSVCGNGSNTSNGLEITWI